MIIGYLPRWLGSNTVLVLVALGMIFTSTTEAVSQEKRAKARISNAGFTITALPLLAAKDWGLFAANGLDVELIVMSPSIAAAALAQGDIDYVAGVGRLVARLRGLQSGRFGLRDGFYGVAHRV